MLPPAHERVGLALRAEVRHLLVAAEVERADGHRAVRRRLDHRAVGGQLLLLVGHRRVGQEQVLGAVQADAGRADADRPSRRRRRC